MKTIGLILCTLAIASSHTIVSVPVPRQATVHTNGGISTYGGECGDSKTITATYTRGQEIALEWGRNNHHTGFTQVSVIPLASCGGGGCKDQRAQLDDPANIIFVSCYNLMDGDVRACKASGGGDAFGLGGDGTDFQQNMCKTRMRIPTYLADGEYVMKTAIFGNGDSFGVRNMPHSSYTNCHNFRVSGGQTTTKPGGNQHIQFKLGDHAIAKVNTRNSGPQIPNNQCLFLATNTHIGCLQTSQRSPTCRTPVADASRCGQASTESRATCIGNRNNDGEAQGGDLYLYMAGLPPYHPNYTGKFYRLHHTGTTVREVNLGGGNPAPAPAPAPAPSPQGAVYIRWKLAGNRNVDVFAGQNVNGNKIISWESHGGTTQRFEITNCGLIKWQGTNRCLDVKAGLNQNGNPVHLWDCTCDNPNQLWDRVGLQLRWRGSNRCMDVSGGSNQLGTIIQIWDCNAGNPNQLFDLLAVPQGAVAASAIALPGLPPVTTNVPWVQKTSGPRNATDSFILAPVGSTVVFDGSSSNNNVSLVCESKFAGGPTEMCADDDKRGEWSATAPWSFTAKEAGTYFFIGAWPTEEQLANPDSAPGPVRLQLDISEYIPDTTSPAAKKIIDSIPELPGAKPSSAFTDPPTSAVQPEVPTTGPQVPTTSTELNGATGVGLSAFIVCTLLAAPSLLL